MTKQEQIAKINKLASKKIPFIFIIDFKTDKIIVIPTDEVNDNEILFSINNTTNKKEKITQSNLNEIKFEKYPISINKYAKSYSLVQDNLKQGNTYLTNLTCETPIKTNLTLKQIFYHSNATYKLLYNHEFVVFSPETFMKIENGKIMSFPMKGTIDATIKDAKNIILTDRKEKAEHATIVDLIRNDLSRVATDVKVDKYRYIDTIKTNTSNLLQVSSQISGQLPKNFHQNLGNIIFNLLPAGSISGAPKKKTVDIIDNTEDYNRGFYTGIFGLFDGENLDSAVMIRFIENRNGSLFFKSGGGVTINSKMEDEYKEMIQKVYLPF